MQARKAVAGSVLAAGLGVAGMIGSMGLAQAAPVRQSASAASASASATPRRSRPSATRAAGFNGGSANASGGVGNVAVASGPRGRRHLGWRQLQHRCGRR
jgi:hypothetical protein